MGSIDCCKSGIKKELTIEIRREITDKEDYPKDTSQTFHYNKVEVENTNENIVNNKGEIVLNQEKNNSVIEIDESDMKEIGQNENSNSNDKIDISISDSNVFQENNNIIEIKENILIKNENKILENVRNIENNENQETYIKNNVKGELNVKSNYILKKIFVNLQKKRLLQIIRYNKNIQKRINININDYEEIYSLIEIEIIPEMSGFDKFINIEEKDEKYYHIYFNDDKKEIKTNFLYYNQYNNKKVSKIKVI